MRLLIRPPEWASPTVARRVPAVVLPDGLSEQSVTFRWHAYCIHSEAGFRESGQTNGYERTEPKCIKLSWGVEHGLPPLRRFKDCEVPSMITARRQIREDTLLHPAALLLEHSVHRSDLRRDRAVDRRLMTQGHTFI